MECKPQVSKETFTNLNTADDRLYVLYDMQVVTMACVEHVSKVVEKRKYFDRTATLIGGIVGGVLGAFGFKVGV